MRCEYKKTDVCVQNVLKNCYEGQIDVQFVVHTVQKPLQLLKPMLEIIQTTTMKLQATHQMIKTSLIHVDNYKYKYHKYQCFFFENKMFVIISLTFMNTKI